MWKVDRSNECFLFNWPTQRCCCCMLNTRAVLREQLHLKDASDLWQFCMLNLRVELRGFLDYILVGLVMEILER